MRPVHIASIFFISITFYVEICAEKKLRLIGAQPAQPGQFPWIVSLQRTRTVRGNETLMHFCAGSIVDSSHVVTAGHCVWNNTNVVITVIAGALNISANEDKQQRVYVRTIHVHPKYKSRNTAGPNDIAILTLATPLKFNERVASIALPDPVKPASGECKYAGWGNRFLISGIYYNPSPILGTVSSTVISRFSCTMRYLFVFRRQLDTALCTSAGPLRGSCQGDSGGPVTCYNSDNTPYLAGVVSWGYFICGDGFHPDVATDVAIFSDFIKKYMND